MISLIGSNRAANQSVHFLKKAFSVIAFCLLASNMAWAAPPATPNLYLPSTDPDGIFNISWSAVSNVTEYRLSINNNGTYTRVYTGLNRNKVETRPAGTYGYGIYACNADGCSSVLWKNITVTAPPTPAAPSLNLPSSVEEGSFGISWSSVSGASRYNLSINNNGTYTRLYSGSGTSRTVSQVAGNYSYGVRACTDSSESNCSHWVWKSITVTAPPPPPPPAAPSLTIPSTMEAGTNTITWTSTGAARYNMSINDNGTYTRLYSGSGTSKTDTRPTGSYSYGVRACDSVAEDNCSNWVWKSVSITPQRPSTINVPADVETNQHYQLTWSESPGATSYEVRVIKANESGWTIIHDGPERFVDQNYSIVGTYQYVFKACNSIGCSPYTTRYYTQVSEPQPPNTPSSFTVPASAEVNLDYRLEWSESAGATSYEVDVLRPNESSWITIPDINALFLDENYSTIGTYQYLLRACHSDNGCSGDTAIQSVTLSDPAQANFCSAGDRIALQECLNSLNPLHPDFELYDGIALTENIACGSDEDCCGESILINQIEQKSMFLLNGSGNTGEFIIEGNGKTISRINLDDQKACPVLNIRSSDNITLRNITFDEKGGNKFEYCVRSECSYAIRVSHSDHVTFDNVSVLYAKGSGMELYNADDFTFINSEISKSGVDGLRIGGRGPTCDPEDPNEVPCSEESQLLYESSRVDVKNSKFIRNRINPLVVHYGFNVNVENNTFTENHWWGQYTPVNPDTGVYENGPIFPGGQLAIYTTDALTLKDNTISHGFCYTCPDAGIQKTGVHGIEMGHISHSILMENMNISGNLIYNNNGQAIRVNAGVSVGDHFHARNNDFANHGISTSLGCTLSDDITPDPEAQCVRNSLNSSYSDSLPADPATLSPIDITTQKHFSFHEAEFGIVSIPSQVNDSSMLYFGTCRNGVSVLQESVPRILRGPFTKDSVRASHADIENMFKNEAMDLDDYFLKINPGTPDSSCSFPEEQRGSWAQGLQTIVPENTDIYMNLYHRNEVSSGKACLIFLDSSESVLSEVCEEIPQTTEGFRALPTLNTTSPANTSYLEIKLGLTSGDEPLHIDELRVAW